MPNSQARKIHRIQLPRVNKFYFWGGIGKDCTKWVYPSELLGIPIFEIGYTQFSYRMDSIYGKNANATPKMKSINPEMASEIVIRKQKIPISSVLS